MEQPGFGEVPGCLGEELVDSGGTGEGGGAGGGGGSLTSYWGEERIGETPHRRWGKGGPTPSRPGGGWREAQTQSRAVMEGESNILCHSWL